MSRARDGKRVDLAKVGKGDTVSPTVDGGMTPVTELTAKPRPDSVQGQVTNSVLQHPPAATSRTRSRQDMA